MKPVYKLLYRLNRLTAQGRQWAMRRFTRLGLGVLVAATTAGIMGPDTENNVTYQAFTILFFLLIVAACFSWFFRLQFSATRLLPRFGTVGCPLSYTVAVKNLTSRTQADLTLLENLADCRPAFADWLAVQQAEQKQLRSFRFSPRGRLNPFKPTTVKEAPLPPIAPGQEVEVHLELTPQHRGVLQFSGLTVARPDPFGIYRALRKAPLPQSLLVLPRRYPVPPLPLPGTLKYQEGGVAMASSVGQSDEFVALRDYRQGDPLRHIHWRSWARTGKPVVKEFEDEFFVRHALVLDTFTDQPHSEAFEEAVSLAASFACTVQTQESLLDLLFVGPQSYCFTAGRGLAHADQMLEILAAVTPCREQPFQTLEHLVLNHVKVVSGCICLLLAWTEERRQFVEKLKALGVPLLVLLVRERAQGEPPDLGPMADEPQHFHVLECGRIEEGLANLG